MADLNVLNEKRQQNPVNEDRKYDFVIFGPTGTVGYEVVFKGIIAFQNYKWAVAGRDMIKINDTLMEVATVTKCDLTKIPIIEADYTKEKSLYDMVKCTKVLINCCGPCTSNFENIVKACIAFRTHYVDTIFDSKFIKTIHHHYNKSAQLNKVYVVHSCGFFGFTNEIIVNILEKVFDGRLKAVDCYYRIAFYGDPQYSPSIVTKSLWVSMMQTLKNFLHSFHLPISCSISIIKAFLYAGLKIPKCFRKLLQGPPKPLQIKCPLLENSFFPLGQKLEDVPNPIRVNNYITFRSLCCSFKFIFWMYLVSFLVSIPPFNWIPRKFPTRFSCNLVPRDGVSDQDSNDFSIIIEYTATGLRKIKRPSDTLIYCNKINVPGPFRTIKAKFVVQNPFYHFTSGALISSAITLLEDTQLLPENGGIYSPGVAFKKTLLVRRLEEFKSLYSFEIYESYNKLTKVLYLV